MERINNKFKSEKQFIFNLPNIRISFSSNNVFNNMNQIKNKLKSIEMDGVI